MDLAEIARGLWRWTAPHPEWTPGAEPGSPGDWERDVGSVFYEGPGVAVFIDPLLPPDEEKLFRTIDRRVRKLDRVVVLTTIGWHRRSRDAFVERYGATTSRARRQLPAGVEAFPEQLLADVYFCGFTSEASFGAWSYLIVRSEADVRRRIAGGDGFLREVLDTGITLYVADDARMGGQGRIRLRRRLRGAALAQEVAAR